MSETKLKCSEHVMSVSGGRSQPCSKPVTVERDGKPYCTIHDPERVAARREVRSKVWEERANRLRAFNDKTAARAAIARAAIEAVNNPSAHDRWFPVIDAVRKWEKLP